MTRSNPPVPQLVVPSCGDWMGAGRRIVERELPLKGIGPLCRRRRSHEHTDDNGKHHRHASHHD